MTGFNKYELELFSKKAADAFIRDGVDLDDSITNMARENGFTDHHVDRVAQKANSMVNGELVKSARDSKADPRISFKLASAADVKSRVRGDDVKKASALKLAEAQLQASFTLPKPTVDKTAAVSGAFGGKVSDPLSGAPESLDPDDVVRAYIKEASVASAVAPRLTTTTLSLACQTLETLVSQAVNDSSLAKLAAGDAEQQIVDQVNELLLSGHTPATLRDVVRVGVGDNKLAAYVDGVITSVGSEIQAREGRSAFAAGSLVNNSHPLLAKIAEIAPVLDRRRKAEAVRTKLAGAAAAANSDYMKSARARRS
jgi:hypothetical protein